MPGFRAVREGNWLVGKGMAVAFRNKYVTMGRARAIRPDNTGLAGRSRTDMTGHR
jgi:hypothetical protein